MPAPSRAERRRANTRQQSHSTSATKARIYSDPAAIGATVNLETVEVPTMEMPTMVAAPIAATAVATSSSKVARRLRTRTAPEPVDYTKDYRDVRRDLRLITIWALLMFAAMFALYFARTNGLF